IAELFEISKSTVGDILNNKEKWLAVAENSADANKKRGRGITGAILSQKAAQFARRLDISDFKSSQ
ncbi:15023_t:CDS:2, partial [Entrophospora sp. SA101]